MLGITNFKLRRVNKTMIKAVLFDIGGVMIYDPDEQIYRTISQAMDRDYKKTRPKAEELLPDLEIGKISEREYFIRLTKVLGIPFRELYVKLWNSATENFELNEGVFKIARELKNNYKIGIISNTNKTHVDYFKSTHWIKIFNPVILSSDVGAKKPDRKVYEIAIKKLDLAAGECVFVDNLLKHIRAAKRFGMKGILFKDAQQLRCELKKLGVNISIN